MFIYALKGSPLFLQAKRKSLCEHIVLSTHDFERANLKGQSSVIISISNWSFVQNHQETKDRVTCSLSDLVISLKVASDLFRSADLRDDFAFDKQSASIPFNQFQHFMTDVIKRFRPEVKAAHSSHLENLRVLADLAAGISAQRMPETFDDATTDSCPSDQDDDIPCSKKLKLAN